MDNWKEAKEGGRQPEKDNSLTKETVCVYTTLAL
jgi:hypothetical protein